MLRRFLVVIATAAAGALVLWSGPAFCQSGGVPGEGSQGTVLALAQPAVGQASALSTFPASEAGISAYIKVDQAVDLAKARACFRGIQAEGDGYLIGIVELEGLPEEVWPHLYVNTDGWLLTYYSKYDPASKLMPWNGYEGGPVRTTTLRDALLRFTTGLFSAAFSLDAVTPQLAYYDFRHPSATRFVLAVDSVKDAGKDSFRYAIPLGIQVFEASWAHCSLDIGGTCPTAVALLDSKEKSKCDGGTKYAFGLIEAPFLTPEIAHTVEVVAQANCDSGFGSSPWLRGRSGAVVVFIYR
jgi:hypothetical protein